MCNKHTLISGTMLMIVILLSCIHLFTIAQPYAILTGKILHARKDSISIIYGAEGRQGMMVKAQLINDSFFIKLELDRPCNIDITDGVQYISGLVEPADSISIKADFEGEKNSPEFDGRGEGKFIYLDRRTPLFPAILQKFAIAKQQKNPLDYILAYVDSIENAYIHDLNYFKSDMSKDAWSIFMGDIKGYLFQVRGRIPFILYNIPVETVIKKNSDSIGLKFRELYKSFLNFNESYCQSRIYILTVAGVLEAEFKNENTAKLDDIEYKYRYISQRLPPKLKVPVISCLITEDIKKRQDRQALEKVITQTFRKSSDTSVKTSFIKSLNGIFSLKVGHQAPDFTLENDKGEKVRLSDFKGKVVYMDFWFAECTPCHQLFQKLKEVKENFKNEKQVVFLNISIDNREIWQKSLSTFNIEGYHVFTEGKEANHPMIKDYQVLGYPTNRLLDKNGNLFIVVPSDNPDELIKEINTALQK